MIKSQLLMGASALVAASVALAGAAIAAPATQVYGAGSTLIGPYLRQVEDCYGGPTPLVYQGAAAASPPLYPIGSETFSGSADNNGGVTLQAITPYDYMGSPAMNCATTHVDGAVQFNYANTGSGNGQLYAMTKDEGTDVGATFDAGSPPNTLQYPQPSGQYGAGDYGIGAADVAVYNTGGVLSQTTGNSASVSIKGVNDTNPKTLDYANGLASYGAFIQFPISVDPVAIAYPPVYGEVESGGGVITKYSFHINKPNKDGSGGLILDVPTVCAIFNGVITNWNDPALKALNGGKSLEATNDPTPPASWSVPIKLVGRSDSSGTTSIIYRAIAAQCNGGGSVTYTEGGDNYTYTNQFLPAGGKKIPTGLQPKYTLATGSGGVANVLGTPLNPTPGGPEVFDGYVGYIGPDYALPAVLRTGQNTFGLNVANLKPLTTSTTALEPTPANALKAFGSATHALLPPQSAAASGSYVAVPPAGIDSQGARANPQDWVEPISTTVTYINNPANGGATNTINTPLADPNHNITGVTAAYPLVGTTQFFLNTCYADATVTAKLAAFLNYYVTAKLVNDTSALHLGVLEAAGLGPLPAGWKNAIKNTFVVPLKTGSFATAALNLYILQAGTGPASGTGSQCKAVSPGA
jgi:ABC-type phosphate transport system substrate-binding protein